MNKKELTEYRGADLGDRLEYAEEQRMKIGRRILYLEI